MKKLWAVILAMSAGMAAVTAAAAAEDKAGMDQPARADINLDLLSAYVWRGQILNDQPVLQPALNVTTPFGLTLGTWFNTDLTDERQQSGKITEVDLTAVYELPLRRMSDRLAKYLSASVGVVEYAYPFHSDALPIDDTGEIYLTLALDDSSFSSLFRLTPTLSLYYDFQEVNGAYAAFSLSHEEEVLEGLTVGGSATVGAATANYNDSYFFTPASKLNDLTLGLYASYPLTKACALGAEIGYAYLMDADIRDAAAVIRDHGDLFYGGLNLKYSF